ncbi:MAG: transposase zinc-binding domain-containing protein [Saprospiraceae bacterium]|nr:transposase zinc-binding domain-containing protein [Saprospiraceae bacterium]
MALGGHVDGCNSCVHIHISYNSCRDRHCPKCQGHKRIQWIEARETGFAGSLFSRGIYLARMNLNTFALHQSKILST